MLLHTTESEEIIDFVYPDTVLHNPAACLQRAILAPTNKQVDEYNSILLCHVHSNCRQYHAADSLKEASDIGLISKDSALDYITCQTLPGLPPHVLHMKTNAVYCLLWNFSINHQLVKNVRVVITEVGNRIITV